MDITKHIKENDMKAINLKKFNWKVATGLVALGLGLCGLVVLAVQKLWNALIPEITGLSTLTYWQALILFVAVNVILGFFRD